jgi:CHAT domain
MSGAGRTPQCPAPETLAAFAEGKLPRAEIAPLLAHLEECPYCMSAVASASHVIGAAAPMPAPQARRWPWYAVAAAAVAAALLLPISAVRKAILPASPLARLVDSTPAGIRLIEPRLTGDFDDYAPFRGPERAADEDTDTRRMKRMGLAGELTERADRDSSAESAHDAGVALLLVEKPLEAVERLRVATTRAPKDAKNWTDLSAALYAAARQLDRPSLYPQALDAADRALRIAPQSPHALFNRALILERLGLHPAARDAWQRYLAVDRSSPWAEEARQRLAKLDASRSQFERDRPRLEAAAMNGDAKTVREVVARYPQQARTWGEGEYLSRWAAAAQSGDTAGAEHALAMTRLIADAVAMHAGESLLRDAVAAIDNASPATRAAIARGQVLYKEGRIAYSRQQPSAAEGLLREAAALFASRTPMALVARYFAANTRFDQNDVAGARAEIAALIREAGAHPGYEALGAELRWQHALCLMYDGDWPAAQSQLLAARATFEKLGERNNLGFIHSLLANTHLSHGRSDDAWASNIRAFEILSTDPRGDRLSVGLAGTARMETRAGRYESARALLGIEDLLDRESKSDRRLANLLVRRAVIAAALGDEEAMSHAREARAAAARIPDPQVRALFEADADFAEGAAAESREPTLAAERLTRAIEFYRQSASALFLPEAYLLRARAWVRNGKRDAALRDLDSGIEAAEAHRVPFAGGASGTGVLDAGTELLRESIRLRLDGGDVEGAFASAERLNAQLTPVQHERASIAELQRRLAGSDAAVLAFAVLPNEVVAFCITATDRTIARQPIDESSLRTLVADFDAQQLFELLIRPSQRTLSAARSLIVVAPPPLETLPFAALRDPSAKRLLVESWSVSVAPSASALQPSTTTVPRSAVAIALAAPSGIAALPESVDEVAEIGRLYPAGRAISGDFAAFAAAARNADVIHIASHTGRDTASSELAFAFPGQRVSWRTIAAMKTKPAATVLLSACETLRRLDVPDARTLSLGGGFLAAGAADVVGTLVPIRDSDARELFLEVHRRLATGESAADAVRAAQLAGLAAETSTARPGAWRAVALLTRRIPQRR